MSNYYPIMLDISDKRIVVVGGGRIAEQKIKGLLAAEAKHITVVAPTISENINSWVNEQAVKWIQQQYSKETIQHAYLVFASTNDSQLNEIISNDASNYDILVCNVSNGVKGSFITPAVARSGELVAAISTAGSSPALAKIIKQELEKIFLPRFEYAVTQLARLRNDFRLKERTERQRAEMLRLAAAALVNNYDKGICDYESLYQALNKQLVTDEGEEKEHGSKSN